jgi:hypothetical protein
MRRITPFLVGAALFAVLALAGGVALAADPTQPSPATGSEVVGPNRAISNVRVMVPSAAILTASEVQGVAGNRYYPIDGEGIHANVDADTGQVRTLFISDRAPTEATVAISPEDALTIATTYLKANRLTTVGDTPQVTLTDRGDTKEYTIDWRMRVNGAWIPDTRTVSVNPTTGQVFALQNHTRPYSPPPTAKVTKADAVSGAKAALGWANALFRDVDLYVSFDSKGSQQLLWLVRLANLGGGSASVFVDGITGQAVVDSRG